MLLLVFFLSVVSKVTGLLDRSKAVVLNRPAPFGWSKKDVCLIAAFHVID